jgi:serine/threonine protein kinase
MTAIEGTCDTISVRGQYGESFRLTIDNSRPANPARFAQITDLVPVPDKTAKPTTGAYFIKCPDAASLSPDQQRRFVEGEFNNGSSINHAAGRLRNRPFTINEMVGRGTLHMSGRDSRPCLIYEYAGDHNQINWTLAENWQGKFAGNTATFLAFAEGFARAVQVLHNQGIVHTFLVPRNIIWAANGQDGISELNGTFTIVGFGYARLTDAAGRDAYTGRAGRRFKVEERDNRFRAPECRLDHSHAAFGYPADIYSIGAILYWMLLGQVPAVLDLLDTPPTDDRLLKRQLAACANVEQAQFFTQNENILKIIDSCLRHDAENRYTCVEELLEAIQIAAQADPDARTMNEAADDEMHQSLEHWHPTPHVFARAIANVDLSDDSGSPPVERKHGGYFANLRLSLGEELGHRYGGLGRGHFEVYGHRDRIVTSLCRLLGSAKKGDVYSTMTLPDYWTDRNLGSLGRFLTMNKHMARQQVEIRRLFLVRHEFHNLPEEEQVVLENQLMALLELEKEGLGKYFRLKVLRDSEEKIADFERNAELVAYLQENGAGTLRGQTTEGIVCLNFFSTAKETWSNGRVSVRRTIKKARYWNPSNVKRVGQFQNSLDNFARSWESAQPLKEFVRPKDQPNPDLINLATLVGAQKGLRAIIVSDRALDGATAENPTL